MDRELELAQACNYLHLCRISNREGLCVVVEKHIRLLKDIIRPLTDRIIRPCKGRIIRPCKGLRPLKGLIRP